MTPERLAEIRTLILSVKQDSLTLGDTRIRALVVNPDALVRAMDDLLAEVESLHEDIRVAGETVARHKAIAQPLVEQYHLPIRAGEDWIKVALTGLAHEVERLQRVVNDVWFIAESGATDYIPAEKRRELLESIARRMRG